MTENEVNLRPPETKKRSFTPLTGFLTKRFRRLANWYVRIVHNKTLLHNFIKARKPVRTMKEAEKKSFDNEHNIALVNGDVLRGNT